MGEILTKLHGNHFRTYYLKIVGNNVISQALERSQLFNKT